MIEKEKLCVLCIFLTFLLSPVLVHADEITVNPTDIIVVQDSSPVGSGYSNTDTSTQSYFGTNGTARSISEAEIQANESKRAIMNIFDDVQNDITSDERYNKSAVRSKTDNSDSIVTAGQGLMSPEQMLEIAKNAKPYLEAMGEDYIIDNGYSDLYDKLCKLSGEAPSFPEGSDTFWDTYGKSLDSMPHAKSTRSGDEQNTGFDERYDFIDQDIMSTVNFNFGGFDYPDLHNYRDYEKLLSSFMEAAGVNLASTEGRVSSRIPLQGGGTLQIGGLEDNATALLDYHRFQTLGNGYDIFNGALYNQDSFMETVARILDGYLEGGPGYDLSEGAQVVSLTERHMVGESKTYTTDITWGDQRRWTVYERTSDGSLIERESATRTNALHELLYQFDDPGRYLIRAERWGRFTATRYYYAEEHTYAFIPALGVSISDSVSMLEPVIADQRVREGWLGLGDEFAFNVMDLQRGNNGDTSGNGDVVLEDSYTSDNLHTRRVE